MGMPPPHLEHLVANFFEDFIGMIVRGPRLISQTINSLRLITLHPLVAGLPAYAVASAQLRETILLILVLLNEFESFFHHACLFPSHDSLDESLGLKVITRSRESYKKRGEAACFSMLLRPVTIGYSLKIGRAHV